MNKLNMQAQLVKVDELRRMITGVATSEAVDHSGEIMDYTTSKPNFQKWSQLIRKTSGGKSQGNLRAMHSSIAAGRIDDMRFNDIQKQIIITAEVVDDNEWKKVLKGVYTGFSIGGSYGKKWQDGAYTRYEAKPTEISLADYPQNPDSVITLVKANGVEVLLKGEAEGHPFRGNQYTDENGRVWRDKETHDRVKRATAMNEAEEAMWEKKKFQSEVKEAQNKWAQAKSDMYDPDNPDDVNDMRDFSAKLDRKKKGREEQRKKKADELFNAWAKQGVDTSDADFGPAAKAPKVKDHSANNARRAQFKTDSAIDDFASVPEESHWSRATRDDISLQVKHSGKRKNQEIKRQALTQLSNMGYSRKRIKSKDLGTGRFAGLETTRLFENDEGHQLEFYSNITPGKGWSGYSQISGVRDPNIWKTTEDELQKGGPGSGESEGHAFRGNQYTNKAGRTVDKAELEAYLDDLNSGELVEEYESALHEKRADKEEYLAMIEDRADPGSLDHLMDEDEDLSHLDLTGKGSSSSASTDSWESHYKPMTESKLSQRLGEKVTIGDDGTIFDSEGSEIGDIAVLDLDDWELEIYDDEKYPDWQKFPEISGSPDKPEDLDKAVSFEEGGYLTEDHGAVATIKGTGYQFTIRTTEFSDESMLKSVEADLIKYLSTQQLPEGISVVPATEAGYNVEGDEWSYEDGTTYVIEIQER